jgi:hypothetical protein
MTHHVICRVKRFDDVRPPRLEFTWSCGAAYFEPIVLEARRVQEFREGSDKARRVLKRLVGEHIHPQAQRDRKEIRAACRELAFAGWELYCLILPNTDPECEVRIWLEDLTRNRSISGI